MLQREALREICDYHVRLTSDVKKQAGKQELAADIMKFAKAGQKPNINVEQSKPVDVLSVIYKALNDK